MGHCSAGALEHWTLQCRCTRDRSTAFQIHYAVQNDIYASHLFLVCVVSENISSGRIHPQLYRSDIYMFAIYTYTAGWKKTGICWNMLKKPDICWERWKVCWKNHEILKKKPAILRKKPKLCLSKPVRGKKKPKTCWKNPESYGKKPVINYIIARTEIHWSQQRSFPSVVTKLPCLACVPQLSTVGCHVVYQAAAMVSVHCTLSRQEAVQYSTLYTL